MGFLKFLGKFFGGLLIFLSLMIIFSSIFFNYSFQNIGIMAESMDTKVLDILRENKNLLAESVFKDLDIDKGYLKTACDERIEDLPEEFCAEIDTLKDEGEIKNALVELMILKIQDQITPQLEEVEEEVKSKLSGEMQRLNYMIPISVFIFLLGSFLIFLAEKFKWKPALFCISLKTGLVSAFVAVSNYFVISLTPENLEKIVSMIPAVQGEEMPGLAVKLISELFLDWVKSSSKGLFLVSLIMAVVSLLIALVMFILKREKPVKVENVKEKPKTRKKVKKTSAAKKRNF